MTTSTNSWRNRHHRPGRTGLIALAAASLVGVAALSGVAATGASATTAAAAQPNGDVEPDHPEDERRHRSYVKRYRRGSEPSRQHQTLNNVEEEVAPSRPQSAAGPVVDFSATASGSRRPRRRGRRVARRQQRDLRSVVRPGERRATRDADPGPQGPARIARRPRRRGAAERRHPRHRLPGRACRAERSSCRPGSPRPRRREHGRNDVATCLPSSEQRPKTRARTTTVAGSSNGAVFDELVLEAVTGQFSLEGGADGTGIPSTADEPAGPAHQRHVLRDVGAVHRDNSDRSRSRAAVPETRLPP